MFRYAGWSLFSIGCAVQLLEIYRFYSVKLEDDSFVTYKQRQIHKDLIRKFRIIDQEFSSNIYFLFEIQSSVDSLMSLRMTNYIGGFYKKFSSTKEFMDNGKFPNIFPLIVYSGRDSWTAPVMFNELVETTQFELQIYNFADLIPF